MRAAINRACHWVIATCLVIGAIAVTGCSSVKTYPNSLPKNMLVTTEIDSGSSWTETVAEFDIHRVDSNCELQYEGRVFLDKDRLDVGIPVDDLIFLDFIFASKGKFSSSVNGVRYGTLLKPLSGYRYLTRVRYLNGIYSVAIRESSKDGSVGRELERIPLSTCKVLR
jgi:hypothetical protein